MLKKKRHDTLPLTLTVKGQGDKISFKLVYNNIPTKDLEELQKREDIIMADIVLAVVKEWDSEYELTREGLIELENDRPGMVQALLEGFNEARGMNKVKN